MSSIMSYVALVVEDENILADSIQKKLQEHGCTPLISRSVEEAKRLFKQHKDTIDFIWLDYYLPEVNGMVFVEYLQMLGPGQPPIFAVTNTAGPDELSEFMSKGVVQTFVKGDHQLASIVAYIEAYLGEN